MTLLLSNNARGRLDAAIDADDTALTLEAGQGDAFPTPALAGDWFPITAVRASDGAVEVMRCTARSGDTLTVARGQDGTSALVFADGDRVELRVTAGMLDALRPPNRNLLINGAFTVNQANFAGGTRAPGVYGYDGWKAGGSTLTCSLSGDTLTHTSGPMVQVVESPDLAGKAVTVSVEDLTGGNLSVNVEGQTGTITAGSGRRGVSLEVPGGSTGNITLTLTPASGAVNYKRVKLEEDSVATRWVARDPGEELRLCKRYYQLITVGLYVDAGIWAIQVNYPVQMRAAPTATLGSDGSTTGTVTSVVFDNASARSGRFVLNMATAGGVELRTVTLDARL